MDGCECSHVPIFILYIQPQPFRHRGRDASGRSALIKDILHEKIHRAVPAGRLGFQLIAPRLRKIIGLTLLSRIGVSCVTFGGRRRSSGLRREHFFGLSSTAADRTYPGGRRWNELRTLFPVGWTSTELGSSLQTDVAHSPQMLSLCTVVGLQRVAPGVILASPMEAA
jgi:hypothetical protein